jgi:CHASE2 domain-containing sensor protein
MKLKTLIIESCFCTLLIFLFTWLLFYLLPVSFKPFNYLANSLKSINLTDIYFSQLMEEKVDTNIVLINIGELNRVEISKVIQKIATAKPKVIGVDVLFDAHNKDTIGIELLKKVAKEHKEKMVWAMTKQSSIINNLYIDFGKENSGFIDLITNESRTEPVRFFKPIEEVNGDEVVSFATAVSNKWDKSSEEFLKNRTSSVEFINYFGNQESFYQIEGISILDSQNGNNLNAVISNKIVLLGFLGSGKFNRLDDLRDLFYTPMNKTLFSRSHPDAYGVVIHANIIRMINERSYLDEINPIVSGIIFWFFVHFHVVLFVYYYVKRHLWYHIFAKLLQIITFTMLMFFVFLFLHNFSLLIDIKITFLAIFISVDLLYLYEALAVLIYKYFGYKSIFVNNH